MTMSSKGTSVIYKSAPLEGIMAEPYFDFAKPSHFWCRRRFEVLQRLAGALLANADTVAEIGCGNGVLQRQVEDAWPHLAPDGFDLHEGALRKNMARRGRAYCYDIHDRAEEFRGRYSVILMFDVLEHIEDEDAFLDSARFHLAPGGTMILNVPALQWLYSPYDEVQGHKRRYSIGDMERVARQNGFDVGAITYWGGPLISIVALRKTMLTLRKPKGDLYSTGFDPGSEFINKWLYCWSRCEFVPQRIAGTSVMAVLKPRP